LESLFFRANIALYFNFKYFSRKKGVEKICWSLTIGALAVSAWAIEQKLLE